jgi:hypothetical protein
VAALNQLAKQYGDVAHFYVVYIREAHAADSAWPMPVPDEGPINTPKSFGERTSTANKCVTKLGIEFPALIDDMDDSTEKAYDAWPDRLFIVDTDGKIAVRAKPGPWGFKPAVDEAGQWLARRFPQQKVSG